MSVDTAGQSVVSPEGQRCIVTVIYQMGSSPSLASCGGPWAGPFRMKDDQDVREMVGALGSCPEALSTRVPGHVPSGDGLTGSSSSGVASVAPAPESVVTPSGGPSDASADAPRGRMIGTKIRNGRIVESVIDIRSLGYSDKKWLVSRKKTRNLGDIVNTWTKTLLDHASDDDIIHQHVDEWQ